LSGLRPPTWRQTVALAAALLAPASPVAAQTREIILATTTSVRDAGLLDSLLPGFERATGYVVKVIAVGSGQAMELGRRGEADLLILHDPAGEERFVAEGFGVDRRALMHNEFVLVGPGRIPHSGRDVVTAVRRIAAARLRSSRAVTARARTSRNSHCGRKLV
jgi:tungstate transport system substrate-binding protein